MTTRLPGHQSPSKFLSIASDRDVPCRVKELPRKPAAAGEENPAHLRTLAEQLISEKRFREAIAYLERALIPEPKNSRTCYLMGVAWVGLGDKKRAVYHFWESVRSTPDWADAWFQLGVQLLQLDHFEKSVSVLRRVVTLRPDWAAGWLNLGSALDGAGRPGEALTAWRRAAQLDDNDASPHYNCGCGHQAAGDLDQAVAAYQRAIQRSPGMVAAHLNLGTCRQELGDFKTALECFKQVIKLAPGYLPGWLNLAGLLLVHDHFKEAIQAYQRALAIDPDNAGIHFKLAGVLGRCRRMDEALIHCRKALELRPDDPMARVSLYELSRHACQWALAEKLSPALDRLAEKELAAGQKTTEWPLLSLWRNDDPQRNLAVAASWSRAEEDRHRTARNFPQFEHRSERRHGPIRIGYLSGDFRAHAVAHQIRSLFGHHDRNRFEIYGYATNPRRRQRLPGAAYRGVRPFQRHRKNGWTPGRRTDFQ